MIGVSWFYAETKRIGFSGYMKPFSGGEQGSLMFILIPSKGTSPSPFQCTFESMMFRTSPSGICNFLGGYYKSPLFFQVWKKTLSCVGCLLCNCVQLCLVSQYDIYDYQNIPFFNSVQLGLGPVKNIVNMNISSRCWFQVSFIFTRIFGKMVQFDLSIFFKWVGEKPPTWMSQEFSKWFHNSDLQAGKLT